MSVFKNRPASSAKTRTLSALALCVSLGTPSRAGAVRVPAPFRLDEDILDKQPGAAGEGGKIVEPHCQADRRF